MDMKKLGKMVSKKFLKGDEEFIPLDSYITAKNKEYEQRNIQLYCCPKCHTVKIEFSYDFDY